MNVENIDKDGNVVSGNQWITTTRTYTNTDDLATLVEEYDLNGNVVETTDPSGNEVDDTFDAANRNTSRSISLASGFLGTTSETRTFDGAGRMLTNEDNDYKLEFAYAVIGLRSLPYTETQSYVGMTAYAKTVTKTYDAAGNKATEAYPSGSNLSLSYTWNDIDNLSSISDGTNTIASDAWIGVRRKTETFQSGAKRTNWYTGFREEIESVRHETSGSSTILRLDYGYNAVHDRSYERFGSSGSPGDAFEYDKLRRLTVAWMGSTTPTSPSGNPYTTKIQYNYDDDGNRTSVVTTPYGQSAQTSSYSTNNLNEYTSVGGTSQSSDANGNLTDNGTYLFLYDYKNHIVQVKLKSSGAVIASYRYDALGRRVEKNVGGTVERHILSIWNDPGVVEDLSHVVSVYDGSDVWRQNFVWSDEVDGIQMLEQKDVLDFDTDGNTTEVTRSFYHRNALGSVMEITDMNQAVVVSYRYDPYGKVTITRGGTPQSSDPLGNHWTFTGRFLDEESGLLYYRARCYDPATGRFLARDPLGHEEGTNLFEYVGSSPSNSKDPTGLQDLPQPPEWDELFPSPEEQERERKGKERREKTLRRAAVCRWKAPTFKQECPVTTIDIEITCSQQQGPMSKRNLRDAAQLWVNNICNKIKCPDRCPFEVDKKETWTVTYSGGKKDRYHNSMTATVNVKKFCHARGNYRPPDRWEEDYVSVMPLEPSPVPLVLLRGASLGDVIDRQSWRSRRVH